MGYLPSGQSPFSLPFGRAVHDDPALAQWAFRSFLLRLGKRGALRFDFAEPLWVCFSVFLDVESRNYFHGWEYFPKLGIVHKLYHRFAPPRLFPIRCLDLWGKPGNYQFSRRRQVLLLSNFPLTIALKAMLLKQLLPKLGQVNIFAGIAPLRPSYIPP